MDVYGYGPWQYACSDDASNAQQQALGGNVPFPGREMSGGHQMPVPSGAPWTMQQMPWGMPDPQRQMMQFTAQTNPLDHVNKTKRLLHCKRKPEDIEPPIPRKQLITEEKMAAHLNSLHLSQDYTTHALCNEEMTELPSTSQCNMMSTDCNQLKGKTLVLSEELRKLKTEPLIPPTLLERLEKPCMSLVLWKPEQSVLGQNTDENETDEETPRRKGLLVDYAAMDVEM